MTQDLQVQLKTTAILDIPLRTYDNDFTFIVNGNEYETSRIISDLLSPNIRQIHQIDLTISTFTINTTSRGDFNHVLELATFSTQSIPSDEISFFSEVIEKLGNRSINIGNLRPDNLTNENAVQLLHQHENFDHLYGEQIETEIEYVSSHFYELCERFYEEMKTLTIETIEKVISKENIKLKNEDQLLKFINGLYQESREYSILYDHVLFNHVSNETIGEFIDLFHRDDMGEETWRRLSNRLRQTVTNRQEEEAGRYALKQFLPNGDQNFDGILKFLLTESNGNISEKVDITASSTNDGSCIYVTQYDNNNYYQSSNEQNAWICFDFKDKKIIPTNYQMKSVNGGPSNHHHPRSWIVEGSNDNNQWETLATENNCSYLNGQCLSHIFPITNPNSKSFRYIRLKQTGKTWYSGGTYYYLTINCFEFYGKLI